MIASALVLIIALSGGTTQPGPIQGSGHLPATIAQQQPVTPPKPTFLLNGVVERLPQGGVTVPVGQPVTLQFCVSTGGLPWTGDIGLHDTSSMSDYGQASGSSGVSGSATAGLPNGDTATLTVYELGGNVYCQMQVTPGSPWTGSLTGVVTLTSPSGVHTEVSFSTPVTFQ